MPPSRASTRCPAASSRSARPSRTPAGASCWRRRACKVRRLELLGVYSDPKRDPRGHTCSVAFLARVGRATPRAGDDAAAAEWVEDWAKADLAFDHAKILRDARRMLLRSKSSKETISGRFRRQGGAGDGRRHGARRGDRHRRGQARRQGRDPQLLAAAPRRRRRRRRPCGLPAPRPSPSRATWREDADCRRIAAAAERFGKIDALVNNAGITKHVPRHAELDGLSAEDFQRLYAVNTIGPFQMIRACRPLLEAGDGAGERADGVVDRGRDAASARRSPTPPPRARSTP